MSSNGLISGYRLPYDPAPDLSRLGTDRDSAIDELWANLYHQGDVDTASYYSVPALVDAGELSLVSAIEVARHSAQNPPVPDELIAEYEDALIRALKSEPTSEDNCRGLYVIHASVHGMTELAKALDLMDVAEIIETYG